MISYVVFFIVFLILVFVLYITFKAVSTGMDEKNRIREEQDESKNLDKKKSETDTLEELEKLKKLLDNGTINNEEFEKIKKKYIDGD